VNARRRAGLATLFALGCTPSEPPAHDATRPSAASADTNASPDLNDPLTQRWCTEVVWPMEALRKGYPFTPDARDADVDRLRELLTPGTGAIWTVSTAAGEPLDPPVAAFLTQARVVADALFHDDAFGVPLEVAFDPPAADHTWALEVSTATATRSSPRPPEGADDWRPLTWPGEAPHFAEVRSVGAGDSAKIHRDGTWGLVRLLESATIDTSDDGTATVTWDLHALGKDPLTLRLRAPDSKPVGWIGHDPLRIFGHDDLQPPRRLLVGGPQCD
jgi:type VI protein secretion system component VasK